MVGLDGIGTSGQIRTADLEIKSFLLLPTELRTRYFYALKHDNLHIVSLG